MFDRAPNLWGLKQLVNYCNSGQNTTRISDGTWVPARPSGFYHLRTRIEWAWMVFTGKADIVIWPEQ